MNTKTLLGEYDLDIDDVRWYLAVRKAEELLGFSSEPRELIRRIWSKALEAELYEMEDRFLSQIDEGLAAGIGV